jgi:hypothetical protein
MIKIIAVFASSLGTAANSYVVPLISDVTPKFDRSGGSRSDYTSMQVTLTMQTPDE